MVVMLFTFVVSVKSKLPSLKKCTDSSRTERTGALEEDEEEDEEAVEEVCQSRDGCLFGQLLLLALLDLKGSLTLSEQDRAKAIIKDTTATMARTMEATATDTTRAIMAILAMTIQDTTIQIMAMDKAMMITMVILHTFNPQETHALIFMMYFFFFPLHPLTCL